MIAWRDKYENLIICITVAFLILGCEQNIEIIDSRDEIRQTPNGDEKENSSNIGNKEPVEENDELAEDKTTDEITGVSLNEPLKISWQNNDKSVFEYKIAFGVSEDSLESEMILRHIGSATEAEFLNKPLFDIDNPSLELDLVALGFQNPEKFCVQIVSINIQGPSEPKTICAR
jgi:hypothetical protein